MVSRSMRMVGYGMFLLLDLDRSLPIGRERQNPDKILMLMVDSFGRQAQLQEH